MTPSAAVGSLLRVELNREDLAQQAAADLLDSAEPPTALLTSQNLITVGALRALRAAGARHHIAVVGFDDLPLGDLTEPGLTVVAQHPVQMDRRTAELVFERLDGFEGPGRIEIIEPELIARGSGEIAAP